MKLIVNADDFGYSRGVNFGIIDSHKNGIVNSTTMMTNMPGAEHAATLAKEHPSLGVGIHLVLTCGKPILKDVSSFTDEQGNFLKLSSLSEGIISLDELEREWTAQIERFQSFGLNPTHFDSHHHVHTRKELLPVVQTLAKKYHLPVRRHRDYEIEGVASFSEVFLDDFYGETATFDYFDHLEDQVEKGKIVEVMAHPAYLDQAIVKGSTYTNYRVTETEILTQVKLPSSIALIKF